MKSEKAFTLVEVVLAIGVFAIVAIPIISMFLDSIKVTSKSENTSEAYAYAQQYVEKLKGGEIVVGDVSNVVIPNTEYTYSIQVNSTTQEQSIDGEDFYQYMNTTDSDKLTLSDSGVNNSIAFSAFDYIKIDECLDWNFMKNDTEQVKINMDKANIWLDYSLSSERTIKINNASGQAINIYLQCSGNDKDNIKIKNIGGVINVYGPITEIPTERGRKKTSNVTVTVNNTRTNEHAELVANVIHY